MDGQPSIPPSFIHPSPIQSEEDTMKYTEVIKLPTRSVLVIHPVANPMDIGSVNRRGVVYGTLADHKNYRETSWTGVNGEAWTFDVTHRGMPPVNADASSRAKRHVIHLTDQHGTPNGQSMLVMPKNILGLYSAVKADWVAQEQQEAIEQELLRRRQAHVDEVRQAVDAEREVAVTSIMRGLASILGRDAKYDDAYPSLSTEVEWNADHTIAKGKITGTVRISYDVYLRLMEYAFEGIDAQ
jgi:hypothetical protein